MYFLRKLKSNLFILALTISSIMVLTPLFLIFQYLFSQGASALNWEFFTELPKPVGEPGGGMKHAILGTFTIVGLASVISVPFGILCGIFLAEYKNSKIANILRYAIDVLTGIPSIVVGIFAYFLVVIPFRDFSAIAGAVALGLIILPIITRTTEEILKLVPTHLREAGLALGLPRWKVTFFIIVRGCKSSLVTGTMLAISRAAGETAPLLFTAFGSDFVQSKLVGPMASLPVQIYNYAISPFEDWKRQAWAGAFVLICMVLGLNILARILVNRNNFKERMQKMIRRRYKS